MKYRLTLLMISALAVGSLLTGCTNKDGTPKKGEDWLPSPKVTVTTPITVLPPSTGAIVPNP